MAITLDDVKEYLRIDGDAEDSLLNRLIMTSEAYLDGAIDDYDSNMANERFALKAEMVQLAIIADLFENRNQGTLEAKAYSRAIESLIRQLQNWAG